MALLLAFDTATKHCAAVLASHGRPIASRVADDERFSHAEKLNVFIDELMREAGHDLMDLEGVAVGIGPGSYTGLRIGLSAAKGLCFALDIPLIGLRTLDILCAELRSAHPGIDPTDVLHPMIDARRMEVYTDERPASMPRMFKARPLILNEAWCAALDPRVRHVVFGDGSDKAQTLWAGLDQVMHVAGVRPSVAGLAACAEEAFKAKDFADLAYLVPEYGKEANVTQPTGRSAQ